MTAEYDIAGIFISSVVPTALLALVATIVSRRLLGRFGAYAHIWHPALFDAALFVIFWAASVLLLS